MADKFDERARKSFEEITKVHWAPGLEFDREEIIRKTAAELRAADALERNGDAPFGTSIRELVKAPFTGRAGGVEVDRSLRHWKRIPFALAGAMVGTVVGLVRLVLRKRP